MLVQQSDGLLASEAERKALPRPYQSFDCVVRLGAWEAGKRHLGGGASFVSFGHEGGSPGQSVKHAALITQQNGGNVEPGALVRSSTYWSTVYSVMHRLSFRLAILVYLGY